MFAVPATSSLDAGVVEMPTLPEEIAK